MRRTRIGMSARGARGCCGAERCVRRNISAWQIDGIRRRGWPGRHGENTYRVSTGRADFGLGDRRRSDVLDRRCLGDSRKRQFRIHPRGFGRNCVGERKEFDLWRSRAADPGHNHTPRRQFRKCRSPDDHVWKPSRSGYFWKFRYIQDFWSSRTLLSWRRETPEASLFQSLVGCGGFLKCSLPNWACLAARTLGAGGGSCGQPRDQVDFVANLDAERLPILA
jgi:hypothetical protein